MNFSQVVDCHTAHDADECLFNYYLMSTVEKIITLEDYVRHDFNSLDWGYSQIKVIVAFIRYL